MSIDKKDINEIASELDILRRGGPELVKVYRILKAFWEQILEMQEEDAIPGDDGRDGKDGADGTDGRDGNDGQDGANGKDGKDGKSGRDGRDGRNGSDGKDGAKGERGESGRDGKDNIYSAEDLQKMIIALGKQWLPFEAIKDLPTVTRELPAISIFGRGSGPGTSAMEVIVEGQSLGQDIRKILLAGSVEGQRNADGVITLVFTGDTGTNRVFNETPTGDIDGVNTEFVLAHSPNPTGALILIKNGQVLTEDVDYTLSGDTITLSIALEDGDALLAKYYEY